MSDDTPDNTVELWYNPGTGEEELSVSGNIKDTDFKLKGAVPNEELRALIEEWKRAKFTGTCPGRISQNEVDGILKAADELEELL